MSIPDMALLSMRLAVAHVQEGSARARTDASATHEGSLRWLFLHVNWGSFLSVRPQNASSPIEGL